MSAKTSDDAFFIGWSGKLPNGLGGFYMAVGGIFIAVFVLIGLALGGAAGACAGFFRGFSLEQIEHGYRFLQCGMRATGTPHHRSFYETPKF